MKINGDSLLIHLVKLVDKEKKLISEKQELVEKFATAENLGDTNEMTKLGFAGMKFERKVNLFIAEKVTVMTMATNRNPDFFYN